jgi:hypothetical protein
MVGQSVVVRLTLVDSLMIRLVNDASATPRLVNRQKVLIAFSKTAQLTRSCDATMAAKGCSIKNLINVPPLLCATIFAFPKNPDRSGNK